MIERLHRALEQVEELTPEAQEELARQIEELTEPLGDLAVSNMVAHGERSTASPQTLRDALALAGAWSDLQDDDEFVALDRIRHASPPSRPAEEQFAWLDAADADGSVGD